MRQTKGVVAVAIILLSLLLAGSVFLNWWPALSSADLAIPPPWTHGVWIGTLGLFAGWLTTTFLLPPSLGFRVLLIVVLALIAGSAVVCVNQAGWQADLIPTVTTVIVLGLTGLLITGSKHRRLAQLERIGLTSRVSAQRIERWLSQATPLPFLKKFSDTLHTSTVRLTFPQGTSELVAKATAHWLAAGGYLIQQTHNTTEIMFGFPNTMAQHAQRACRSSLELRDSLLEKTSVEWTLTATTQPVQSTLSQVDSRQVLLPISETRDSKTRAPAEIGRIIIDDATYTSLDHELWTTETILEHPAWRHLLGQQSRKEPAS
ncbi:MAG: hypothetical protein ACI8T1_002380 [Verrucomicrobiales bacterium]|jgi:hypothetical protein